MPPTHSVRSARTSQLGLKICHFGQGSFEWVELSEEVRAQYHQKPFQFCVVRLQDCTFIGKLPEPLSPGSILVFEATRTIEHIDAQNGRQKWEGNSGDNVRFNNFVLRWNGVHLGWFGASTVSNQSSKAHWGPVNHSTAERIVRSILSGSSTKPPPRNSKAKARDMDEHQDLRQLQKKVDELQTLIDQKDNIILNLRRQLGEVLENTPIPWSTYSGPSSLSSAPGRETRGTGLSFFEEHSADAMVPGYGDGGKEDTPILDDLGDSETTGVMTQFFQGYFPTIE